ncbi:MAG: glycoside hydrolase family 99-like domain-containing protein [Planctomycetota bacterium]|nr:glycoside hydrolase family 99-like domain-containing protein [Planctomycetota bacterium]
MAARKRKPSNVAIYCPLWHNYDHASSWKGEGWCEWELLKSAIARFPGHYQPLRPSWGCFDESDPAWAAREIDLAADHGLDVFLFDWYWYSGVKLMEEALERGFLQAPNNRRLKFALMWANHEWSDYFPPPFGKPWNWLLPIRHSAADMQRIIAYCVEHYFRRPNYWQVDGRLFFSVFQPGLMVQQLGGPAAAKAVFAELDAQLRGDGLPPLHWNAMVWSPAQVEVLREAGFHSTTSYNLISSGKAGPDLVDRYEDLMSRHLEHWAAMSRTALPHNPVVTMGWDVTPRCEKHLTWPLPPSPLTGHHDYPYMSLVLGNTPNRFAELCRRAAEYAAKPAHGSAAIFINAWNEWTEGSYLLPEERTGTAYLEAIRDVLGAADRRR